MVIIIVIKVIDLSKSAFASPKAILARSISRRGSISLQVRIHSRKKIVDRSAIPVRHLSFSVGQIYKKKICKLFLE